MFFIAWVRWQGTRGRGPWGIHPGACRVFHNSGTILCQAQASYVVGSPVPLPLSPGPPVRLYFLVVLYASPLWAARIESGAGIESGAAIIPARQQRGEQNLINLVRNSRRAATTMDGGPKGSVPA